MAADTHPTRGFSENRHVPRVAAEVRDIVANPGQRGGLVEQAFVSSSGDAALRDFIQVEKA